MNLQLQELLEKIPPLGSQSDKGMEAIAFIKFFTPWSYWTWYAVEFDGDDTFFGYVIGIEKEFGYFLFSELLELEGPFGLKVEIDEYFKPKNLSNVLNNSF